MASAKFTNTAKNIFFKLEEYDFTKRYLIYSLITRKQNWKNKDIKKTAVGALKNYTKFYTPNLNESKGQQLKDLFTKVDITIPKEGFIFTIDEFKTVNYKHRIADNLSLDYSKVLNTSLNELKENFIDFNDYSQNELKTIEAIEILIDRIINEIHQTNRKDKEEYIQFFKNIKDKPAQSFKEALQRILFFNQLLWQTGHNLNGFGRLDYVLNDIYQRDSISKEEALSLIKDFLRAGHSYYIYKSNSLIGDTGQIIVLGGLTDNKYFTNDLTYLFIEAVKELQLPDPKLILRYTKDIPDDLFNLAIECMATGVGSPLISNDGQVIPNLINFGYEKEHAENYVVSACWEPAPVGKGLELNNIDSLVFIVPLNDLLDSEDLSKFNSFDEFLAKYKEYLLNYTDELLGEIDSKDWETDPLLSLYIDDCNLNKKDFSQGGAHYNNYGLTSVSLSNTINSLYNVKKLVFEDNLYTLEELNNLRKDNFRDDSVIETLKSQAKFGMDSQEIIDLTNDILDFTNELFKSRTNKFGDKFKFGLSAPSYIAKSPNVKASFDGRKDFEPFNVHISNEDNKDYTELMRFASKLNYTESRFNGNVVDFMITPDFIKKNFDKFCDFLKISLDMGVFQMQLNVVDSKTLIDAQANPDKYPNLIVRVWGFSTYFKDLPKDYQDVLIKRALENEGKNH